MTAHVIDGKAIAAGIKADVKQRIEAMKRAGVMPCLAAVLIGEDAAALSYARSQEKHAAEAGIAYRLIHHPGGIGRTEAETLIEDLNADSSINGVMLHMPVSRPVDAFSLQQRIAPEKDVEGVGATNLGLLAMGRDALAPCTAAAALACLKSVMPDLTGRDVVVIGRSVIVGKPLAMLLLAEHATVTQCHSRTRDLPAHTRGAEAILVAAGSAGLIGAEHVAPGTAVIDVGVHRATVIDATGREVTRTIGDVRYDEVTPLASAITPVPGGVGPVTVAMLLDNVARACERLKTS